MDGFYVGDIIGNSYTHENFHYNKKTKDFEFFTSRSKYSDDTILTFATIDWLLHSDQSSEAMLVYLKKYYSKYPDKNPTIYGPSFVNWIENADGKYRSSVGNGGAMRASAIGFYATSEEQLEELVYQSMRVTHNSEEGLKSALMVAMAVFKLRNGMTKQGLKQFMEEEYNFNLTYKNYNKYRKSYTYDFPNGYETVRPAIIAFLFSENFEDAIRNAVAFGGDTDTLTTITANLADAFYGGVPKDLVRECRRFLNSRFKALLNEFEIKCKGLNYGK